MSVAVLFAMPGSVYFKLPADVYDKARDARSYRGGLPVVAHPPCAQWGQLRHQAHVDLEEKALAPWAVDQVRRWGGVLEHPKGSLLWPHCGLPYPGTKPDKWGGWSIGINQREFGHRAEKPTLLYIVGIAPASLPALPLALGEAECTVGSRGEHQRTQSAIRPEITKRERHATPQPLAEWLLEVAKRCGAVMRASGQAAA